MAVEGSLVQVRAACFVANPIIISFPHFCVQRLRAAGYLDLARHCSTLADTAAATTTAQPEDALRFLGRVREVDAGTAGQVFSALLHWPGSCGCSAALGSHESVLL